MDFILPKNTEKPGKGKLMMSDPFFSDLHFGRSLVLLCNHDEKGSFGFVLNKEIEVELEDITQISGPITHSIYLGGPVEKDRIFFIHTRPDLIPGGEALIDKVFVGGEYEKMQSAVQNGDLNDKDIRFFLGYSGWSAGQLQQELDNEFWYIKKTKKEEIFSLRHYDDWKKAMAAMGGNFEIAANYPQDPSLN